MLKNLNSAGRSLLTSFGELVFDENGLLQKGTELSEEAIEVLVGIKGAGFERVVAEKAQAPVNTPVETIDDTNEENPKRKSRRG